MSVGLYMDVHVPLAVTRALRRRGVDVQTAQEDGTTDWEDPRLLDRAGVLSRVLFTEDQDLLTEAARRHRAGLSFTTVIFARQTSVSIGRCVEDLEVIAKSLTPAETRDQVIYLPL